MIFCYQLFLDKKLSKTEERSDELMNTFETDNSE